ncbi:hypothetical protein ACS0TY_018153 [Phlomoides rotata]
MIMSSPSELSFDIKPQIYSMLQKSFGDHTTEQTQKLEDFVARLEEERLKIDAFKRELPLCMQLLTNAAMEASRQQLQSERANVQQVEAKPLLEEFIPLKNPNSSNMDMMSEAADKANWMTSAQLWNQESEGAKQAPQSPSPSPSPDIKLALNGKQRINGGAGAFLPFSSQGFPELALNSSHKDDEIEDKGENSSKCRRNNSVEKEQVCGTSNSAQTHRKARRCWSPDLHRRFVNALHMLGGSQAVATPKQIRELMKVDGLTNDEVKSHLQKYRLHTRRPSLSPQASHTAGPQVVVLGGIWVPPEYAAHGGAPLYGAHHVSPSFCSPTQQEIYPAIAPPPPPPPNHQLHYQTIHHHQHMYNNPPLTQRNCSPESGGASESIEDGKSESGSWKADSGGDRGGE